MVGLGFAAKPKTHVARAPKKCSIEGAAVPGNANLRLATKFRQSIRELLSQIAI
jgi:hypothetical protein